jgi:hypothetical protein
MDELLVLCESNALVQQGFGKLMEVTRCEAQAKECRARLDEVRVQRSWSPDRQSRESQFLNHHALQLWGQIWKHG